MNCSTLLRDASRTLRGLISGLSEHPYVYHCIPINCGRNPAVDEDVKTWINNGRNYQPKLAQDFFNQQQDKMNDWPRMICEGAEMWKSCMSSWQASSSAKCWKPKKETILSHTGLGLVVVSRLSCQRKAPIFSVFEHIYPISSSPNFCGAYLKREIWNHTLIGKRTQRFRCLTVASSFSLARSFQLPWLCPAFSGPIKPNCLWTSLEGSYRKQYFLLPQMSWNNYVSNLPSSGTVAVFDHLPKVDNEK